MNIFVGSTNPVKINAVKIAAGENLTVTVSGYEVASGVSVQPMTEEETKQGAINRARAALQAGQADMVKTGEKTEMLGLGLEGGIFLADNGEMWSTVWAAVVDEDGEIYAANGARVKVPEVIAEPIKRGAEMGPVMQKLTGEQNIKTKQGMFGVITNNFITRTEEYATIAKMALGIWYGRNWQTQLKFSKSS